MKTSLKQSVAMGLLCLPFGLLGGLVFGIRPGSHSTDIAFAAAAPVASLVAGTLAWWLMVVRRRRIKVWRGALAGAVSVIFAHWFTVKMVLLVHNAWLLISGGDPQQMQGVFDLTIGDVGFALLTLLVFGGITIPIGAALGSLLIVMQRSELPRAPDVAA